MWERLGGYKQRYAPEGAGAEDAEFWLRAGAYGFNARKVTNLPLFIYSWETGRVSGNPDYKEVDWRVFHPWTKDQRHPFASVATPQNTYSHWVRSYDRPVISVVIPVGNNHIEEVLNALDSLEGQTERGWEAILVDDTGEKSSARLREIISKTYPYAKYIVPEKHGAGAARNAGARAARGSFLLFLDADDWLYPEALESMLDAWEKHGNIIYSDYVGKAFLDEESAAELGDRLLSYNYKKGEAVIRHYSADYECERALRQPDKYDMYIWCLITALVPTVWHEEIEGFDENMESWEDWDYWIRMARNGKCFTRIEEPLVVYRFYTGGRRELGLQQYETLVEYLTSKLERGELPMGCNCGGNKRAAPLQRASQRITPASVATEQQGASSMQDDNMVLCVYTSPNTGQHKVVGAQTGKNYGYRGGGEVFYVHKADIALQPHLFKSKEETKPEITKAPEPPPAPPSSEPEPAPQPIQLPPQHIRQPEPEQEEREFRVELLELDHVPGVIG
jgi:glycosyltransferase involved in cell wall biosynthesis